MSHVENCTPVLKVADLPAAFAFYSQVLGFQPEWGTESGSMVGSVGRESGHIMLASYDPILPSTVWIGVGDIVPYYEAAKAHGCTIVQDPTNQPWAYEFRMLDPDGNILWFGSGPL